MPFSKRRGEGREGAGIGSPTIFRSSDNNGSGGNAKSLDVGTGTIPEQKLSRAKIPHVKNQSRAPFPFILY